MPNFDPYYRWLGIPPAEQPPNHYRLLGVALFETNSEVIQEAADRQMAHVKTHKNGPHREISQRLLNELSAAKICLLRANERAAYDAQLRGSQRPSLATPGPVAPRVAPPATKPPVEEETVAPRRVGAWLAAVVAGAAVGLLMLWGLSLLTTKGDAELGSLNTMEPVEETPEELAAPAATAPIEAPGLVAEIFEGADFQRLIETRMDPQVSFFWGSGAASEGLPGDDFSVRWTGWLRPPSAGSYTFSIVADEPAKLWVDDKPLLLGAADAGPVQTGTVELEGRPTAIKLEYSDTTGGAWISFRWQPPGGTEEATPTWALFQDQRAASQADISAASEKARRLPRQAPVDGRAPGLAAEFYSDKEYSTLLERRVDPVLDFFWYQAQPPAATAAVEESPAAANSAVTTSAGTMPSTMYARWRGYLTPPQAGKYTLVLGVDDGAQIWIDGKVKLDARRVGEPKRFEVPIVLSAERHTLRVDYFRQSGDGVLTLHWIVPDGVEQVIPAECFSRAVK